MAWHNTSIIFLSTEQGAKENLKLFSWKCSETEKSSRMKPETFSKENPFKALHERN